jgi:hypothetical protein
MHILSGVRSLLYRCGRRSGSKIEWTVNQIKIPLTMLKISTLPSTNQPNVQLKWPSVKSEPIERRRLNPTMNHKLRPIHLFEASQRRLHPEMKRMLGTFLTIER